MRNIIEILYLHDFLFYRIVNGGMEFVSSDNPVMFINIFTKDPTPFLSGLSDPATIVYYPISPKLLLAAKHPSLTFGTLTKRDCRIFDLDIRKDADFIFNINRKQIEQCSRQAFAKSENVLKQYV